MRDEISPSLSPASKVADLEVFQRIEKNYAGSTSTWSLTEIRNSVDLYSTLSEWRSWNFCLESELLESLEVSETFQI